MADNIILYYFSYTILSVSSRQEDKRENIFLFWSLEKANENCWVFSKGGEEAFLF